VSAVALYIQYRVAKTHRMPGRAASGGALAPEPAARHRGRTPGPTDFSEFLFPFFFPLLLRSDVSHQKSEIGHLTMSDLRSGRCLIRQTMEMEYDHYKKVNREVRSQKKVGKIMKFDVRKKSKMMSDVRKLENDGLDAPSAGALVRPLWRAAAPGLKPLRLPRAQLQVIFRKRATNYRAVLRKMTYKDKASYGSSGPRYTSGECLGAAALQTQYSPMKLGFRVGGLDSRVCTLLINEQVLPRFTLGIFQWG